MLLDLSIVKENSAFLITDRISRRYFLGVDIAEGCLILSKTPTFYTDARYFYSAKISVNKSCPNVLCELFNGINAEWIGAVSKNLKAQDVKTLFVDYERTTVKEYNDYKLFNINLADCSDMLKEKRRTKAKAEIENISSACDVIEKAFYKTVSKIKLGITEKQVEDILIAECKNLGASEMSFDTIVAFGKNSAVPHHETGETVLEQNMPILIDCGCKINGYCSDYTRTFFFGRPSAKFIETYNAVKEANEKAEREITVGMNLKDADGIARDYLKTKGVDKFFTHSLGHCVGLEIHEEPRLSYRAEGKLKENDVFTIEPGVYFDGEFGIRIEDTVVLEKNGVRRLFSDSKELIVL